MVEKQQMAFEVVYIAFILINFALYIFSPVFHSLFIATPFDLGRRGRMTVEQRAASGERNKIELILLLIILVVLYISQVLPSSISWEGQGGKIYTLSAIPDASAGISGAILKALMMVGIAQVCYVVVKFIFGVMAQCPGCKELYARELVHEVNEPTSTFQKTERANGNDPYIATYEAGTTHSDWKCPYCQHEWHTTSSYKKRID